MSIAYNSRKSYLNGYNPDIRHYNPYSFDFVTRRIAVGGYILDKEDASIILDKGITHIINCGQTNEVEYFPPNFTILLCPVRDDGIPKPISWYKEGIDFAFKTLSLPKTKLYIHCHYGRSRSPSLAYAILRALGFNRGLAYTSIVSNRPLAENFVYRENADQAIKELGYD